MGDVSLLVNGRVYAGWKSARVTRGIEAIAGSFDLEVTDRWGEHDEPWPIVEEDECSVLIDGKPVITGYVDRRSPSFGPAEHRLSVSGRDRTGSLVDCSAELTQWEFRGVLLLTLAKRLADPFGIPVTLQPGLAPAPVPKLTVDPGETAFDALERACRMVGVLPVPDGVGGLVLMRPGTDRAVTELVQGENILAGGLECEALGRFRRYVVSCQQAGSDRLFGAPAAAVRAEARDADVRRGERVLIIRPESGATQRYAQQRAAWECTVRAARGSRLSVVVQGWQQGDGSLWPVGVLVRVRSPFLGLDTDMLISETTYSLDSTSGTTTSLSLVRPDAFVPEPQLPVGSDPSRRNFAPA